MSNQSKTNRTHKSGANTGSFGLTLLVLLSLLLLGLYYQNIAQVTAQRLLIHPQHSPVPEQVNIAAQQSIGFSVAPAPAQAATVTITPVPGGEIVTLYAAREGIGWVTDGETVGNQLGDSFLYAGTYNEQIYLGMIRFNVSLLPRGVSINDVRLQLTGLRDDRLGDTGTWRLRWLEYQPELDWERLNFQRLADLPAVQNIAPNLESSDLAADQPNLFTFSDTQRQLLEDYLRQPGIDSLYFRLEGPQNSANSLFAWDTGYGSQSDGNRVLLQLSLGPEPTTLPPLDFVVVTSTPTPENVITAAAIVARTTADATRIGTATALPFNLATATPFPESLILTATPTPGNAATATIIAQEATAIAMTTGTATPIPAEAITATPTATASPSPTYVLVTTTPTPENIFIAATQAAHATEQATREGTSTPLPENWVTPIIVTASPTPETAATADYLIAVATAEAFLFGTATATQENQITATPTAPFQIVTSTSTPASIFEAATQIAQATVRAQRDGPATSVPANWVTPIVVTSTPTPANAATAAALTAQQAAEIFVYGTPTPTPVNQITATPTPIYILLTGELPPLPPTSTPTPKPGPIPDQLIGKIAFKSDRSGEEAIYVINSDGSELALLSDIWPYVQARSADAYSADGRFRVYNRNTIRYEPEPIEINQDGVTIETFRRNDGAALYWFDALYQVEQQLTFFGSGIAYDGVWSPTSDRIAFVATESQNDEIWVVNRDGSELKQLTANDWEWDKHPSWSPDGQQIVFWSNRSGNQQVWVMNADGSNLYSLSRTGYNDWDPVWIKYPAAPVESYNAQP